MSLLISLSLCLSIRLSLSPSLYIYTHRKGNWVNPNPTPPLFYTPTLTSNFSPLSSRGSTVRPTSWQT